MTIIMYMKFSAFCHLFY